MLQAQPRRQMGQFFIQTDDGRTPHLGRRFLGRVPARSSRYVADYFDQTDSRNKKFARVMDDGPEEARIRASQEILDPTGGINNIHSSRSGSRSNSPGIPRRSALNSFMERSGNKRKVFFRHHNRF
jgi:hypothetical protein